MSFRINVSPKQSYNRFTSTVFPTVFRLSPLSFSLSRFFLLFSHHPHRISAPRGIRHFGFSLGSTCYAKRWSATGDIIGSTRFTGIAKLRTIIVRTIANYLPINYRRSEALLEFHEWREPVEPSTPSLPLSRFSF